MTRLKSIRVVGWKSIKDSSVIELGPMNVFIGANGAGKSNLVSFFKLLNEMIGGRLQEFIATSGGAESVLHYGAKATPMLEASLRFETETGTSTYFMKLVNAAVDTLVFTEERIEFHKTGFLQPRSEALGIGGHPETRPVQESKKDNKTSKVVRHLIGSCRVYQFHDTSASSHIRKCQSSLEMSHALAP